MKSTRWRRRDPMTATQRSFCMSQVKSKDTSIEKLVRSQLHFEGFRFRKHYKQLPGRPDIAFPAVKVAVFIDGDFWHGYRFTQWRHKVSKFWKDKITENRRRDSRNFRRVRRLGWKVIRIWEHQIRQSPEEVFKRIKREVRQARKAR